MHEEERKVALMWPKMFWIDGQLITRDGEVSGVV